MAGVVAYASLPTLVTRGRAGRRFEAYLDEIAGLDGEIRRVATGLPNVFSQAARLATEDTRVGGNLWRQLRGSDPRCGTARALSVVADGMRFVSAADEERSKELELLLTRKVALLAVVRRDVRYRALLDVWLWLHIPLAVATLTAVAVHIFVVFYYR
jgi:hypothetical protein